MRTGLTKPGQKELLSKYLYDDVGSALFEVISRLPQYGLTRADERRLLRRHSWDVVERLRRSPDRRSRTGQRQRPKDSAASAGSFFAAASAPLTIPSRFLRAALPMCERELSDIDSISILGFEREYLDGLLEVAAQRRAGQHLLVLFLGSTIGNFDRPAGIQFLAEVRRILQPGDSLLCFGTDLAEVQRSIASRGL